ncbi:MAG: hypothetical protein HC836_16500 [Richelia sp. RM2_1_2]|nr:hypothetical protein [Richelia sp. RM2_1_2]
MEFRSGKYTCVLSKMPLNTFDCKYSIKFAKYLKLCNENIDEYNIINPVWNNIIENALPVGIETSRIIIQQLWAYPNLKLLVFEWLNNTVGLQNKKWAVHSPQFSEFGFEGVSTEYEIFFKQKQDALLFKLTWS